MSVDSGDHRHGDSERYRNKIILAPMVRIGTLSSRLLALEYGADMVYSEEIIDWKLIRCRRFVNQLLGTTDFIDDTQVVVFRTCDQEKDKVVLQLGTCDPDRALQAAKLVEKDVSGIDVNMGCPKDFSLKGGMGAALLTQPQKVRAILSKLVTGLSIPVTCKIRLLPDMGETISLVKVIESTGVAAIAVHGRTKAERPKDKNNDSAIRQVVESVKRIPVIANGGSEDIRCYEDIEKFRHLTGASSVMIARASESNPSIFRKEGLLPLDHVIRRFMHYSILFDNHVSNVKYVIQHMLSSLQATESGQRLITASELRQIYSIWNMDDFYDEIRRKRELEKMHKSTGFCLREERSIKRFKKESDKQQQENVTSSSDTGKENTVSSSGSDGKGEEHEDKSSDVTEECMQFLRSKFRPDSMPKQLLNNFSNCKLSTRPEYRTITLEKKFYTEVKVNGRLFRSTFLEKNKKNAEQAAALIACLHYHLIQREAVADCILTDT